MTRLLSIFLAAALALAASVLGVLWLATPPPREETYEEWEARQW